MFKENAPEQYQKIKININIIIKNTYSIFNMILFVLILHKQCWKKQINDSTAENASFNGFTHKNNKSKPIKIQ